MHNHTNRLADEKSPYLLQHAHNPVDWFPWGEEAFAKAKAEDKPIFLSIGYATCHWCHVMERESFEDHAIAQRMNDAFVCIKVDREERPDIDAIYMTVCQMMTGQGGWPLTIIMTPDQRPFYAATYIPPEQRYGRMGMKELIPAISDAWNNRREHVLESAGQITHLLAAQHATDKRGTLTPELLHRGYEELLQQYDRMTGGFGSAPKFPTPHRLLFLLREGRAAGLAAAEHTLREMRKGGLFDQVGFGFHRYSTDRNWLVPHFEKMLYDQALLALAYTEAYERTGDALYRQVTEEIFEYVLRDMTDSRGGFYSAEDADSEGREGQFYIWSAKEMAAVLGDDFKKIAGVWNIAAAGNYDDEMTGQRTGNNIPHLSDLPDSAIEPLRKKLFAAREQRIRPLKDTKVLADWNGLMMAALARAGRVFGEERYITAAARAASFVLTDMRREDGTLWHRWRDGQPAVPGQLDDYAFMIFGLLELYEATLEIKFLSAALSFNSVLDRAFIDEHGAGYFMTAETAEPLIIRPKEIYDGALPSGNSVQMLNLLRLARLTGRSEMEQQAVETGKAFVGPMESSPSGFSQALIALHFAVGGSVEIVVVGPREDAACREMIRYINSVYRPDRVLLFKDPACADALAEVAPFTREMKMVDGQPTVYLCRNHACEAPIVSLAALKERYS